MLNERSDYSAKIETKLKGDNGQEKGRVMLGS